MRPRSVASLVISGSALALVWGLAAGEENHQPAGAVPAVQKPVIHEANPGPEVLTREYCSACHSFQLVQAQRLNRATWEWVMEDMVEQFGAGWITPPEQTVIIDYLVEHYGPEK